MKINSYYSFAIRIAFSFVAGVVGNSKATAEQKATAEKLLAAGDEFLAAFGY